MTCDGRRTTGAWRVRSASRVRPASRVRSARGDVGVVARVLLAMVAAYRWIPKPGLPRCRFYPSCSAYALEALERHGALRGLALVVRRVARCHPFNPGGIDMVPEVDDGTRGRGRDAPRREGVVA